jgi:hypothetical protein
MRLNTFHAIDQKPKLRQPIGIHVSPGEIAEEFLSACVVPVSMRFNTFHAIGQKPKMRQPIGIHVSPGEIAEEVSVYLCCGCKPSMLLASS